MSREAFEAWIKLDSTLSVERDGDGDGYRDMDVYLMWRAWQAAQADAYERAAKVCEGYDNSRYVKYDSNNSGGKWWMDDDDWKALEEAGWEVDWCANLSEDFGRVDANGRWLGALATSAKRPGLRLHEAIDEFERVTKRTATDSSYPICGQPHYFTEYTDDGTHVASGPNVNYPCEWE